MGGMLKGRYIQCTWMVFKIQCVFIDRASGCADTLLLTSVDAWYTNIINMKTGETSLSGIYKLSLAVLRCRMKSFKEATLRLFGAHCVSSLFTVNSHLLDRLCDDWRTLEPLGLTRPFDSNIPTWSLSVQTGKPLCHEVQEWWIMCPWWGWLCRLFEQDMRTAGTVVMWECRFNTLASYWTGAEWIIPLPLGGVLSQWSYYWNYVIMRYQRGLLLEQGFGKPWKA